jgi:hypothetical protein
MTIRRINESKKVINFKIKLIIKNRQKCLVSSGSEVGRALIRLNSTHFCEDNDVEKIKLNTQLFFLKTNDLFCSAIAV